MSFQWIVDMAESISIDRKHMVASTQTRSGIVRAASRGAMPVRITVRVPDGPRWSDIRSNIAAATALDRYQTAVITIPYAKFPWYYGNVAPVADETYTVICTEFPDWTIFARDQVSWSGAFVFQEYKA
jgi:hypothetical protein